jgi:hypothetical protein
MRGKVRTEKRVESRKKSWMVWTKRLKLRIGGMYKVRGTAEKATANRSCNINFNFGFCLYVFFFCDER